MSKDKKMSCYYCRVCATSLCRNVSQTPSEGGRRRAAAEGRRARIWRALAQSNIHSTPTEFTEIIMFLNILSI